MLLREYWPPMELYQLFERERTGEGRLVDTSLFEAGITQTYWQSAIALASGISPDHWGRLIHFAPYQAFRNIDGWINIGASMTQPGMGSRVRLACQVSPPISASRTTLVE